jgi:predicted nuclease of predicted toxin-antitoxin system
VRLLANENIPGDVILALRGAGHDVVWAATDLPGAPDEVVLSRAQAELRTLITFDKDFGELAFRAGLPAECGVVLFRLRLPSPEAAAVRVTTVLAGRSDWQGHFSVVEEARTRMRPLP